MTHRKNNNNKRHTGFISLLLALLGIGTSSCIVACMYGSPSADYSIKGKVTDSNGRPIPGLQVALGNRMDNQPGVIYDQNYWPLDTVTTGYDGKFQADLDGFPISKLQIDIKDLDGPNNGGEFSDLGLVISDIKLEGGKGWYEGHADIQVPDIILTKISEE